MKLELLWWVLFIWTVFFRQYIYWVCGEAFAPKTLTADNSLDFSISFYVNKYVDHHAFEIVF